MEEQTSNKTFRGVIAGLRNRIEAGMDFSAGLAEYPDIFDELYVSMMRAGEAGGMLAEIAARLARYLESAVRLRRKVRAALIYPRRGALPGPGASPRP
jgi:type IV pilus assembly protein PilC